MLWLLLLLTLSSASLQGTVKDASLARDVSSLNPNLEDMVPKMAVKSIKTIHHLLPSIESRLERQLPSSSSVFDKEKVKWVEWDGNLPKDPFSVYNAKKEENEYVCRVRCNVGFYNPTLDNKCHYTSDSKQMSFGSFYILVNEDHFEMLEWRKSSDVSDPKDLVRTCPDEELYVGKNEYGLGKVDLKKKKLYYAQDQEEKQTGSYDVLTISNDLESQLVFDFKYKNNNQEIEKNSAPTIMKTSTVTNKQCVGVSKTATLSKTTRNERRWDIGASLKLGVKTTFSMEVPIIASGSVELGLETSFETSGGNTVSEEVSHSETIEFKVPPNHSCTAKMVGRKYKADIPFTAHLKRTYKNGRSGTTTVNGKYHGVQIGGIHVELERCTAIPGAQSCSKPVKL